MRLATIHEDFDKAVAVATKLRDLINRQLNKTVGSSVTSGQDKLLSLPSKETAASKMHLMASAMGPGISDHLFKDLTPEENETVWAILGRHFSVDPAALKETFLSVQEAGIQTPIQKTIARNKYTPDDWLYDYARHNHIPVNVEKPAPENTPDQVTPTAAAAPVVPHISDKGQMVLNSMGIKTLQDLTKVKKIKLLTAGLPTTELMQLVKQMQKNGLKFAESVEKSFKQRLTEAFHGHHVGSGTTLFDKFMQALDVSFIDFDPLSSKFQALAKKILKRVPTADQWLGLIVASSIPDQLKEILMQKVMALEPAAQVPTPAVLGRVGHQTKPPKPARARVPNMPRPGLNPVTIHMKRGTVINVDHAVMIPGTPAKTVTAMHGVKLSKPYYLPAKNAYVLAGIGAPQPPKIKSTFKQTPHPDFVSVKWIPNLKQNDPSSSMPEITRNFSKILSMNPANIAKITDASGQTVTL